MFCKYCGAQMDDHAAVCPACGKRVERQAQGFQQGQTGGQPSKPKKEKKPKKKMSKGKKALVGLCAAGVIIIGLGAAGTVFYFTSPARKIAVRFQDGEYTEISSIYNGEIKGNFIQETLLDKLMTSEVADVIAEFKSGSMDYAQAQEKLTTAQGLNISGLKKDIEDSLEMLDSLNSSITAYEKAEQYYAAGQYSQAIEEYSNVIEEDDNYEDAQSKIEECVDTYKKDILAKTEGPEEYEEYENALSLVQVALDVLPDDKELKERESELQKNYAQKLKSEALTNGTQYISDGKYDEIFELLDQALEANPNDSELTNLYNTAVTSFEDYAAATVDGYVQNEQFGEAYTFLNKAEDILPDSEKITELRSQVRDAVPVKLSEMKISDSDRFEAADELSVKEDVIGNVYSPGNLYISTSYHGKSYATCYLNSGYTKLKGVIAVADNCDQVIGEFTIYGDNGQILYTSGDMSRTTAPIAIDINVEGVKWITIAAETEEFSNFVVLVSDFVFYK